MQVGILDKCITNKKKGITEYADLTRVSAINQNKHFQENFDTQPKMFAKKTGIFTHLYDAAARFGEDKPFKV
jgi:hypothetical protein